jgi:hypothetical protein
MMNRSSCNAIGQQRAPVNGICSEVNRQEYKGGQFLPIHGVFCGQKGKTRQRVWSRYPEYMRIDAGGRKVYEVMNKWFIGGKEHRTTVAVVLANNGDEAVEAVKAKGYVVKPGTFMFFYGT